MGQKIKHRHQRKPRDFDMNNGSYDYVKQPKVRKERRGNNPRYNQQQFAEQFED